MLHTLDIDEQALLFARSYRVVVAHALDETTVATILTISSDHIVKGPLLGAAPGKSDDNHHQILEITGKPAIIAPDIRCGKSGKDRPRAATRRTLIQFRGFIPFTPASSNIMPRIPYVSAEIQEPAALVQSIRERRGGDLLNLDRMLLHSAELAAGWNLLLGAVRRRFDVSMRLREIAICVVAVINRAEYEFIHHAPELLAAGGTQAQVDALRDPDQAAIDEQRFNQDERDVIALTIDMTRSVTVRPGLIEGLNARMGEQHTVELVATIASYNMVSRLLIALGVEPE